MLDVFNAAGQRVPLGKELGTGGEGTVYDAPMYGPDFVAKVYHQPLSQNRRSKLLAMVEGGSDRLRKIAAWPVDTIHSTARGSMCGFIMPKVIGYEPIHHLYGPGHRKQQFPNADWAFLVNAARNVAAAFDVIHSHHHAIGDVNQNNIVVARNSIVKLIDCDSFQITTTAKDYLCEVGVGHFTPPELQGRSFNGVRRDHNHDNFGLAVLIFHLLLMGRHPYCGVYSGPGEMPIEKAIREFRFAFGSHAASKKMAAPPNSVPITMLPSPIVWLFERAFSEEGVYDNHRPSAKEWLTALESLKSRLQTCHYVAGHQYFDALDQCPWCKLEQQSKIFFFNTSSGAGTATIDFDAINLKIVRMWEEISAIPSPGAAVSVSPASLRVHPTPLPRDLGGPFSLFKNKRYRTEIKRREAALEKAREVFNTRIAQWREKASDEIFNKKFRELFHLRLEYEQLVRDFERERGYLQHQQAEPIMRLIRIIFRIKSPTRSAVDQRGNPLKESVISDNGKRGGKPSNAHEDTADLVRRFTHHRNQLEVTLEDGISQLRELHEQIIFARQALYPLLLEATQALAQAEADIRLIRE